MAEGLITSTTGAPTAQCSSLTVKQRSIIFCSSWLVAVVFIFMGCSALLGNYDPPTVAFGAFEIIGIIVLITSTFFVVNIQEQLAGLKEVQRIISFSVYIVSMIMTLVSGFAFQVPFLAFVFAILMILAHLWFTLSFIPYFRGIASDMCGKK